MFNTAIVSPIYYVMFTLFTITASLIMFQVRSLVVCQVAHPSYASVLDSRSIVILSISGTLICFCNRLSEFELFKGTIAQIQEPQTGTQMVTEGCGFTTIVIGTFLLHATRELDISLSEPPSSSHTLPFVLALKFLSRRTLASWQEMRVIIFYNNYL